MTAEHTKDPCEVSGWGPGHPGQDASDIARDTQVNAEFDPEIGRSTTAPRGAGEVENQPAEGPPSR
jgi:hypothetical protein